MWSLSPGIYRDQRCCGRSSLFPTRLRVDQTHYRGLQLYYMRLRFLLYILDFIVYRQHLQLHGAGRCISESENRSGDCFFALDARIGSVFSSEKDVTLW